MKNKILLLCIFIVFVSTNSGAQENNIMQNNGDCTCQNNDSIKYNYMPTLQRTVKYKMFEKLIDWKLEGGEELFRYFFVKNFRSTGSSLNFNLVSFEKSTTFTHPDGDIGINLTPCLKEREFHINAVISRPVSNYIRNFDWENDYELTAKKSVDILSRIAPHKTTLFSAFLYSPGKSYESIADVINQQYDIELKFDYNTFANGQYIDSLLVTLKRNNIPFENFLLNTFILTDTIPHLLNDIEENRINKIFNTDVVEFFTQRIRVQSDSKYIGFIIGGNVLQRWDNDKNTPVTDSLGNHIPTEILATISGFIFETGKGIHLDIANICLPKSEISGTGIVISYFGENAELVHSSRLVIHDGVSISIPNKKINVQAKNVNINNKSISGEIIIPTKKYVAKIARHLSENGFIVKFQEEKNRMYFEK